MNKLHSINALQGLYVMACGAGFSCYGFAVLDKKARGIAAWMGTAFNAGTPGTESHYMACMEYMDAGAKHAAQSRTKCPVELTPELVGLEGKRVEVITPTGDKSRFWVSRSGGWMPCHIELKNRRSTGGGAVYFPAGSTLRVLESAK